MKWLIMACIGGLFSIRLLIQIAALQRSNNWHVECRWHRIHLRINQSHLKRSPMSRYKYECSDLSVIRSACRVTTSGLLQKEKRANMQIFRTSRTIFEWIGILDANSSKVKLVYRTCLVSPILLLLPSIAYAVANISDVSKATSAFYITCVLTMTHLKYLTYLHHKSLIRSIVIDFEAIVESSGWSNHFHLFSPMMNIQYPFLCRHGFARHLSNRP